MRKVYLKLKKWLLRIAINYIVKSQKDSIYIQKAIREFDITWKDWKKKEMQNLMCNQIIELLAVLSTHGDSGSSIEYKKNILNKLIMFRPISKLTFKDNEFSNRNCFGEDDKVLQNIRNSAVFKNPDGTITYNNAFSKDERYYIGEELKILKRNGGQWSGQLNVLKPNGEIYRVQHSGIIKDLENFSEKTFIIPIYAIEYPKDWWTHIAKEEDLKDLLKEYYLKIIDNTIDADLDFQNGKHRQAILERIELVKNHK